jgi:O-antigen ligase
MSLQERLQPSTYQPSSQLINEFRPIHLVQLLLIPLLFVGVLYGARNAPEWLSSYHLDMVFLYATPLLLLVHIHNKYENKFWIHIIQICILILLTFILLRQHNKYIPVPSKGRTLHVSFIFLLYAIYPLIGYDFVDFIRSRVIYIGAYILMLAVFFFHVNNMSAGSTKASFVVYTALFFGISVFFIPRHVSRNVFLWSLSLISGFSVGIGLPAYIFGTYKLFWLQPTLFGAKAKIPLVGIEYQFLQSFLSNPNILAVLAFTGAFGGFVLAVENFARRNYIPLLIIIPLTFLNGLGLYLTHARASWLAFTLAVVVYLGYLVFGRRSIPFTVIPLAIFSAVVILMILLGIGPIDGHGRSAIWMGGLRALRRSPSVFGYGVVNTHKVIAPFITVDRFSGFSPHNSYIQTFLQIGVVGGLAYMTFAIGSIIEGVIRWRSVDVPMIGLALAFAVHQTFAVYTLFNNAVASILGIMVVGYLICGYIPSMR